MFHSLFILKEQTRGLPGTKERAEEINELFNQIDQHEKEIAH